MKQFLFTLALLATITINIYQTQDPETVVVQACNDEPVAGYPACVRVKAKMEQLKDPKALDALGLLFAEKLGLQ